MKREIKSHGIILLLFVMVTSACSWPDKILSLFLDEYSPTEAWQDGVDRLVDMTVDTGVPEWLLDLSLDDTYRFLPNHLLLYMDHLSRREGYSFEFVYVIDENSSYPIVYAIEEDASGDYPTLYTYNEDEVPFPDYEAYQVVCEVENPPEICDFLNFVEGDGTEAGYFQYILLSLMGEEFYLGGAARENAVEVVADSIRIRLLANSVLTTKNGTLAERKIARQIRRVDPAPIVVIEEEQVMVTVTWFTPASGLYRTVFTMTPDMPYQIIAAETEQLVEFQLETSP